MEFAYDLSGGSNAVRQKHQVAATNTVLGVPYLVVANGGTGVVLGSTTGAVDAIGVNLDTAGTYVTAQQSDNSDTTRTTSIICNPLAVYRARLSGTAAAGGALTLYTATSGGSNGLTVVMDTSVASPDMDECMFYNLAGTNAGKSRKCTSTSSLTATFIVSWPIDAVAGDTFIASACTPAQTVALTLCTELTEVRGDLAPTGAAYNVHGIQWGDRTNTYLLITFGDHASSGRPT